jgi:aspartate ammonia-lyase
VAQVAMLVMGHDQAITLAVASGSLELNPFLPLIAHCLLESLELLARAGDILARLCIEGMTADESRCRAVWEGATATATALLPLLGHEAAGALALRAAESGRTIRETALAEGLLTAEQFAALTSAEAVCRLGSPLAPAALPSAAPPSSPAGPPAPTNPTAPRAPRSGGNDGPARA